MQIFLTVVFLLFVSILMAAFSLKQHQKKEDITSLKSALKKDRVIFVGKKKIIK